MIKSVWPQDEFLQKSAVFFTTKLAQKSAVFFITKLAQKGK